MLIKVVTKASEIIATIITGALAVTMLLQIVARKIFNSSLSWTDEFGSFMLVWIALFGSVIVLYEGKHLAIDAVVSKLKKPWINIVKIAADIFTLAFVMSLFIYGIPMAIKTLDVYAISLHISKGIIYSIIPITALFMSLILFDDIYKQIKILIQDKRKGAS